MKEINIAVIACGGRARGTIKRLLDASKNNVKIVSVYDPDENEANGALEIWDTPKAKICKSYQEAIEFPNVNWVMVFSPNAFHKEQIIASFRAGKNVFTEKPLATKIEDCQEISTEHLKSGKIFATGFVLRYAPIYKKIKETLSSGKIGKLISIDANENISPEHGGYIMCNWRRKSELSGPHILEKCCHDLDLINWFVDSVPSRVASFGGRNFFTPENQYLEKKYSQETFKVWRDPHAIETPFNDDSDMMDNQVAIAEFRNNVRVMFQATMSNTIPERRMYFSCSEGTMIVELYQGTLRIKQMGAKHEEFYNFGADGHGGGDEFIMSELYETMINGSEPKCSGREGLESAVTALAFDQAAITKKVIELEDIWQSLGR